MALTLPELLAPAGNMEKLKVALSAGADAVYVGTSLFGLRKYADNFSKDELATAIHYTHEKGKAIYVVLNGFATRHDLASLHPYLSWLETVQPDGFIIADIAVFSLAKQLTSIDCHVSTQASVTNRYGCQWWKDQGASRVVLAREVTVDDCRQIRKAVDIELEVFIHGAMCASYSGKCVISNYTAGRDSNRGGCVQSCRHDFKMADDTAHIMNAKDLQALPCLPDMVAAGIDSLKIEGRMKSVMYVANTVSVYREALTAIANGCFDDDYQAELAYRLSDVSNRRFSTGGLAGRASGINTQFKDYEKRVTYIGIVKAVNADGEAFVHIHGFFSVGDTLDIQGRGLFIVSTCYRFDRQPLTEIKPNMVIILPSDLALKPLDILRQPITN